MRPVKIAAILIAVVLLSVLSWVAQGGERAWAGSAQSPDHQGTIPFTRTPVPQPPADTPQPPQNTSQPPAPTATPTIVQPTSTTASAAPTATTVPPLAPSPTATRTPTAVIVPVMTQTPTSTSTQAAVATDVPTHTPQPTAPAAGPVIVNTPAPNTNPTVGGSNSVSLVGVGCLLGAALILSGVYFGYRRRAAGVNAPVSDA